MFDPFQKYIQIAANRHGISTELKAATICQIFRNLIPEIFKGKKTPEKFIQPAHFKKNTLTINVENQAWAEQIIIRKEKIIEEMNQKAGQKIIKNLRTQLKKQ
jgi:hypothetical protein